MPHNKRTRIIINVLSLGELIGDKNLSQYVFRRLGDFGEGAWDACSAGW